MFQVRNSGNKLEKNRHTFDVCFVWITLQLLEDNLPPIFLVYQVCVVVLSSLLFVEHIILRFSDALILLFAYLYELLTVIWIKGFILAELAGGLVAQWITRLTTDQKIPGSNPGELDIFFHDSIFIFVSLTQPLPWCKHTNIFFIRHA